MNDYSFITQEMFDEKLKELVGEMSAGEILSVEGVYEGLSEELNNRILDELFDEHQADNDEEEEE